MKKKEGNLIDLEALDPAVASAISYGQRRISEQRLPKAERKRVKRERAKSEARRGKRALYDLPEAMINGIKDLADENRTTASQVAMLALHLFLADVAAGRVDLRDWRVPIANPKYEFRIDLGNGTSTASGDTTAINARKIANMAVETTIYPRKKSGDTTNLEISLICAPEKYRSGTNEGAE